MAATSAGRVPQRAAGVVRARATPGRAPHWLSTAAIGFATLAVLVQVRTWSSLGNGDYYLRNAIDIATGHLPHSRYSPGFPVVLAPLAAVWRGDPAALTVASGVLTTMFAAIGLVLLHRWLLLHVAPWPAAVALALFALGQASATFLTPGEVEPLALCLVTGVLLACGRERWKAALVLTAAAVLVRVALGPFLAVLWLLQLRARPRTSLAAGVVLAAGLAAHLAVGPRVDQSYAQIGGTIYGVGTEPSQTVLHRVLAEVGDRFIDYVHIGVPRLVWPFALLQSQVGWLVAGVTIAGVLFGLWRLVLGPRVTAAEDAAPARSWNPRQLSATWAAVAFIVYVALLLLWPVRDGEATRMVVPVVGVPLLALAVAVQWLQHRVGLSNRLLAALLTPVLLLGVASVGSLVAQRWSQSPDERDFAAAHRAARHKLPPGGVISVKPAYSQMVLGIPGFEYPKGIRPEGLATVADRTQACAFVVDGLHGEPANDGLAMWVYDHAAHVVSRRGGTAIIAYDVPRCR
jgi:hypothetical protein